jgi:hypothetical protein
MQLSTKLQTRSEYPIWKEQLAPVPGDPVVDVNSPEGIADVRKKDLVLSRAPAGFKRKRSEKLKDTFFRAIITK